MLKGKTAIVTGSTSGIGLGMARALGDAGAHLMLNGFGDAAELETLCAGLAKEFGVEVAFSDRWDAVIAINLSSNFHAIKAVPPHMESRNRGRIVNIASTHGLVASVEKSAYVAAKHGVLGLTKSVALEMVTGITCNAICPGWVLTPLVQRQIDERAKRGAISVEKAKADLLAEKQPSGGFATPEQIGALCAFLCSDAAAQMRGVALPVDGGWLAR